MTARRQGTPRPEYTATKEHPWNRCRYVRRFLKMHLFGDIFARDNLDWRSREIATVAALATLDGVESQLRSHLGIALNTGLTETDLQALVMVLHTRVGQAVGDRAGDILDTVLAN